MSQILEEFDQPSPSPVTYCQKIPMADVDTQSAKTTKEALHSLMAHLEEQPDKFYKILRQKKADKLKLLQLIKVKTLSKFKDDYLEKYFPEDQCREELENLKREMASAFDYAQDGKRTGVRFSERLAEKCRLKQPISTSTPKIPTAPPPPPPPPPIMSAASNSMDFISPITRLTQSSSSPCTPSGTFQQERDLLHSIRAVPARRKLHNKNSAENNNSKKPCLQEITAARTSLRATRPTGSSDVSPHQLYKARQPCSAEENFSMFNMELLRKFQNTHSPSDNTSPTSSAEF